MHRLIVCYGVWDIISWEYEDTIIPEVGDEIEHEGLTFMVREIRNGNNGTFLRVL